MDFGASVNNVELTNPNQVVNYMGSSWIIRRSKSHNGMLYFFNTVTREAVWNLNEAEIEKAKKLTNSLGNQMENVECPEPKEPPTHNDGSQSHSQQIPSRVYNKQIINNQMQQPFTYFPSACTQVLPYGSVPLGWNVSNAPYNSNIWTVPPLFMTSSSPVIQQAHTSFNVTYNDQDYKVPVQSTSKPLSNRFPSHCETYETRKKFTPNQRVKSPLKRNNFQRDHKHHFVPRNYKQCLHSTDLRNVLSARKSHSDIGNTSRKSDEVVNETALGEQCSFDESSNMSESNNSFEENCQTSYLSDVDVDFFESERKETTSAMDFSKLKQLAGSNTNPEQFYIVADKNIMLNHLNFLGCIINSVEQCRLMVPREIMDELRIAARTSCGMPRSTNRSRRAVLFATELLKSGRCLLGEPSQDSTVKNYILRCCSNLTQQNYQVVLLTNNAELLEIKRLLSIPIFTIKEIKQFLTVTTDVSKSNHEQSVDLTKEIVKITIANDLITSPIQDTSEIINIDDQTSGVSLNNKESPVKKEIQSQTHIKETIDAAVQTESPPETTLVQIDQQTTMTLAFPPPQPNIQKSVSTTLSTDTQNRTVTSQCEASLKKGRRLVRSRLHQTTIGNNTEVSHSNLEKKQFKWRKRRNASKPDVNSRLTTLNYSHLDNSKEISLNADIDANSGLSRERNQSVQNTESINTLCDDIIEDSETSSSIVHRNINDKIVIEETSTSGVISNTTSHADSESESVKQHEVTRDEEITRQNMMFNVIDRIMEQSLRMRCDEWVSRFVQIMEEALTQILLRCDQIIQNAISPPWTLYEAAHCIKITFRGDHDVMNASSRLLNVLDTVSDGGRIKLDLNPQDYMEMYSYGVYLIDVLQSTSQNCDDLQTASDSLSNLLNDIRNPTRDIHNDTFCESTHIENHEKPPSTAKQNDTHQAIIGAEVQPNSQSMEPDNDGLKYNLRSNNKKIEQDKKQQTREQNKLTPKESADVSFIRNIDFKCNFFTSLHLQENKLSEKGSNVETLERDPNINRPTLESQANDFNKYHQSECVNGHLDSKKTNFKSTELKIGRTFNEGPEFEEKLHNQNREFLDMDQLDYSEDIEGNCSYMDDDYYSEEECYEGALVHNEAVNVDAESTDLAVTKSSRNIEKPKVDINANDHFPSIFRMLFLEIKEAFLKVQSFCKEAENELVGTQYTSYSRKIEILENAEKAYSYIDRLRETLNSVLYRESCTDTNHVQSVLKQVGLDKINDLLLREYRTTISKCVDQAKVLLDSLDIIKNAVKA